MRLLLDTHLLLWAAEGRDRLSPRAIALIADTENSLIFSAASVWEIAVKQVRKREDFQVDAGVFRRGLLDNDYEELPILGTHAAATRDLPPIHKDPFDRLLIAQAAVEGILLLTADRVVARYAGPNAGAGMQTVITRNDCKCHCPGGGQKQGR